jgi:hypothetical protein
MLSVVFLLIDPLALAILLAVDLASLLRSQGSAVCLALRLDLMMNRALLLLQARCLAAVSEPFSTPSPIRFCWFRCRSLISFCASATPAVPNSIVPIIKLITMRFMSSFSFLLRHPVVSAHSNETSGPRV